MLIEIPKPWREAVIAILRRGKRGREVLVTKRAADDWCALTLNPYDSSLTEALANALRRDGLVGRAHPDMNEPGETYAFVFQYDADHGSVDVYAKVLLFPNRITVKIVSAHRPLKDDELTP